MSYLKYIDLNKTNTRFKEYEFNKKLYKGEHADVFNIKQFEYYTDPKIQYIVYNYTEILTNVFKDLIWSEKPVITLTKGKNQKYFDDFVDHDEFFLTMKEATETASHSGEAVFQISTDEIMPDKIGPSVTQIDNGIWYPIYDENNPGKKAKGHIKCISKPLKDRKITALLLEIHTPGQIEWEAYYKADSEKEYKVCSIMDYFSNEMGEVLVNELTLTKEGKAIYQTKCRYPLIFHMRNNRIAGEHFGRSDYTIPVISKSYAINQNYNQIQYVLKKHSHPKMIVPKEVIKQAIAQVTSNNSEAKNMGYESAEKAKKLYTGDKSLFETLIAQKLIDKLEFYGSDVNSTDPKYLTWDGNLTESRENIKMLKQALTEETQLAKVLIDPDMSVGTASGVAILRLAQPSLSKAQNKISFIENTMKKIIYTILELASKHQLDNSQGVEAEIPTIKFRDGLVNDIKEEIEKQQLLLDNQLTTKLDAIIATRNLTQEQAVEKLKEIESDNNLFGIGLVGDQTQVTK